MTRKFHMVVKLGQYCASIAWLLHGLHMFFIDQVTCQYDAPWLSFTMLATLLLGCVQLLLFSVMLLGIVWWFLATKVLGLELSYTPASLWHD
jgi:hypothetical protein